MASATRGPEKQMYDVLIVGAGISAATLCAALKHRLRVCVVDVRDHPGGNCYDYPSAGAIGTRYRLFEASEGQPTLASHEFTEKGSPMEVFTTYTPSHRVLFDEWFLPALRRAEPNVTLPFWRTTGCRPRATSSAPGSTPGPCGNGAPSPRPSSGGPAAARCS